MSNNTLFLETTAIIDYCKHSKSQINEILEKHERKVSAQFVKMEIKRGYIRYFVLLHNKLTTYPSFADVMASVHKLSLTPQRNLLSTILESLAGFFREDLPKEINDFDEYLRMQGASYLRIQIKRVWKTINKLVDEILNPMDCFLDISPPRRDGVVLDNKPWQCVKSEVECKIKQFFADNEKEFVKILDALKALPEKEKDQETKKRIKALKNIIRMLPYASRKISNKEQNYKECWYCGDAILAVLAPRASTVLTSNIKHYKPICEAIEKDAVNYLH
jgi:hypothetical protein